MSKYCCHVCGKNTQRSKWNYDIICTQCAKDINLFPHVAQNPHPFFIYTLSKDNTPEIFWKQGKEKICDEKLVNILKDVLELNMTEQACRYAGHIEEPTENNNVKCTRCGAYKWSYDSGGYSETSDTISVISGHKTISRGW
jgi:hypothetical protein